MLVTISLKIVESLGVLFYGGAIFLLLSPVTCLPSPISSLPSPVSRLPTPVLSPLSPVSLLPCCTVSTADLIHNNLVVLWSKLADLGNLAILMLLADLADLYNFLADMKFSGLRL